MLDLLQGGNYNPVLNVNETGTVKLRAQLDLRQTVWHWHFGHVHDYRL